MAVTVTPQQFTFVDYDAAEIERLMADLAAKLGITTDIALEVDETSPLARVTVVDAGDPITVRADSGALEDTKRLRQLSARAVRTSIGRVLLRLRDRASGAFDDAPPDTELTLPQQATWDTYCVGRLERIGVPVNQQRWRYNFRNRHGFNDDVDVAFDRIFAAEGWSWAELAAVSEDARAVQAAARDA
ncbi:MAG: hypothetical protein QOD72_1030 [Acidimicrobiaceae bacterium]|jgi:hypothetical protein|nr:hypothetical protein [Acidimicrobiaceae bacterium]